MRSTSSTQRAKLKGITSVILLILVVFLFAGCLKIDPLVKHKFLTTIFDGVPDAPSVEELCEENIEDLFNRYYEQKITEASTGDWDSGATTKVVKGSAHRPWKEKDCQGCHNFQAENKLLLPKKELCYLCHKNFIQGKFVHGPVSVGSCLACHDPHSSDNSSLLRESLEDICFKCHIEERLTKAMHAKIIASGMLCVDCHDPHSRNIRYFLK